MADGPEAGLAIVDGIAAAGQLDDYPYLHSARADLLRRLGRRPEAAAAYRRALELAANEPERAFLERVPDRRAGAGNGLTLRRRAARKLAAAESRPGLCNKAVCRASAAVDGARARPTPRCGGQSRGDRPRVPARSAQTAPRRGGARRCVDVLATWRLDHADRGRLQQWRHAGARAAAARRRPRHRRPPVAARAPRRARGFDAASISGTAKLAGWQSSDAESAALKDTITAFEAQNSEDQGRLPVVAGDYPTVMATNFASKNVPDLFYVDASYGQTWADQGFLEPLDDYIAKSGFDTSTFFPGYLAPFKGSDGKIYGLPKDGNTIGMAYNTADVTTAPTTHGRAGLDRPGPQGQGRAKTPMCLNASLDRGLAFIYAKGGAIVSDDGKTEHGGHARDQGRGPVVSRPVQERPRHDGQRPRRRLVRRRARQGPRRDGVRGRLARSGDDQDVSRHQVHVGRVPDRVVRQARDDLLHGRLCDRRGLREQGPGVGAAGTSPGSRHDQVDVGRSGPAVPSDVPTPQGKDVLVQQAPSAKPGSGFMKGFTDVQDAFNKAFLTEVQKKTYNAGPVIQATRAAVDKALSAEPAAIDRREAVTAVGPWGAIPRPAASPRPAIVPGFG